MFEGADSMCLTELYEHILNRVKIQYIDITDFDIPENTNEKDACVNYMVSVKANNVEYQVQKRFREFFELHKKAKKRGADFPEFPSKTIVKLYKIEKIEKRKNQLPKF